MAEGSEGREGRSSRGTDGLDHPRPSRAEWAVGLISCLLVALALGYIFYQALFRPSTPAMVHVEVDRIRPMPAGGYLAEVTAVNSGAETAASAKVALCACSRQACCSSGTASAAPLPSPRRRPRSSSG